ncbi:hypothetical protein D3C73_1143960 [compost metagenome]
MLPLSVFLSSVKPLPSVVLLVEVSLKRVQTVLLQFFNWKVKSLPGQYRSRSDDIMSSPKSTLLVPLLTDTALHVAA